MSNSITDAVKTAKSIHDGNYSSLHGKSFVIRVNMKKKGRGKHVKKHKSKFTLNQIGELVVEMSSNLKKVNTRLDNLENRIDKIDARLDYIVKANSLKDSK